MKYFTSDQHFFDTDIMSFADRPYSTPEEMNDDIIRRFVEAAQDADEVYILGDIFGSKPPADQLGELRIIMKRLGADDRPFYLMRGNHDHLSEDDYISAGFQKVMSHFAYIELSPGTGGALRTGCAGGTRVMISHDPCMIQPRGTTGICGHVHTLFAETGNAERDTVAVNVSVEVCGYAPVSEAEIMRRVRRFRCESGDR